MHIVLAIERGRADQSMLVTGHQYRNCGVLCGPAEEAKRLVTAPRLLRIQNDQIIVHLHLQRDAFRVLLVRATKDKLDLDIAQRTARLFVVGQRHRRVRITNYVAALKRSVVAHDTDKHVDWGEVVDVRIHKRWLERTVIAPGHALLVRVEDMLDREPNRGPDHSEAHEPKKALERVLS